jgi:hypothetical protein
MSTPQTPSTPKQRKKTVKAVQINTFYGYFRDGNEKTEKLFWKAWIPAVPQLTYDIFKLK